MLKESDIHENQQAAIDRLYNYNETLLIAGVGYGKALVGLTAAQDLLQDEVIHRLLVLAPLKVATLTWATEPGKWSHLVEPVAIACGTEAKRRAAFESDARIVVCNLDNTKWAIDNYGHCFDALLVDEMSKLGNAGGVAVRALRPFTKKLTWRAGMSATPVAENPINMYSQALLLDLGKALGTRKDAFLQRFFYPTDYEQRNWEPLPGTVEAMAKQLRNLVWVADDQGYAADLPELEDHLVTVDMGEEAWRIYREMSADGVAEIGDLEVIAANEAVSTGKKQQIAAGGLYAEIDGVQQVVWTDDHKQLVLPAVIAHIDGPVIVVYQFEFEKQWLRVLFPDAPVLGGGGKFSEEDQAAWNRGEIPIIIGHPKSFGMGLNLQHGGCDMVFLSPLWSNDQWIQTIGRLQRRGSPFDAVRRWTLVTKNTVEEHRMLQRLADKKFIEDQFMAAFRERTIAGVKGVA